MNNMDMNVTVKQALDVASQEDRWISARYRHPQTTQETRASLKVMYARTPDYESLKNRSPEQKIDVYIRRLKKKYIAVKNDKEMRDEIRDVNLRTLKLRIYQGAFLKVSVYLSRSPETVEVEASYPSPTRLLYTKETLLGLNNDELRKMAVPVYERNVPAVADALQNATESASLAIIPGLKDYAKLAPTLRELERYLKYDLWTQAPIRAQFKSKSLDYVRQHGEFSNAEFVKSLDPVEKAVWDRVAVHAMILRALLTFKQYVKLQ